MNKDEMLNKLNEFENNQHYIKRYITFIYNCKNNNNFDESVYTERHHILPKSIFPEYENLNKNKFNCVVLTARQHFISHHILAKAFPKRQEMQYAFWLMICIKKDDGVKITNRVFEEYKIAHSKRTSELMSVVHKGKTLSEEHKKAISDYLRTRVFTEEQLNAKSERMKGDKNPMFGKDFTKEHREKISKANSGSKNGRYGKEVSLETRKRISDALKKLPKVVKVVSEETRKKIGAGHRGKIVSSETRKKISELTKDTITCYVIELDCCKRIPKTEYNEFKNIKYFSISSKEYKEIKKNKELLYQASIQLPDNPPLE